MQSGSQYPPVYPNWGESLGRGIEHGFDSLMGGLAAGRQNRLMVEQQNINRQMQLHAMQQAQANADRSYGLERFKLAAETGYAPDAQQAMPGMGAPENLGVWGEYQRFMSPDLLAQGKAMGAAKLQKAQAEAGLEEAKRKAWEAVQGGGGLATGPQVTKVDGREFYQSGIGPGGWKQMTPMGSTDSASIRDLASGIIKGQVAPSQLPGFGRDSLRSQVLKEVYRQQPNSDLRTAEAQFAKQRATATYEGGSAVQTPLRYLNSVQPNLAELERLADRMDQSQVKILNRAMLLARENAGDTLAAQYNAVTTEVSDQVAKILQGGGSGSATTDAKMKQALEIMDKSYSPQQMRAVASSLRVLLANRQKALLGQIFSQDQRQPVVSRRGNSSMQTAEERLAELTASGLSPESISAKLQGDGFPTRRIGNFRVIERK